MFVEMKFGGGTNKKPAKTVVRPWTHQINGIGCGRFVSERLRFVSTETGLFSFKDSEETGAWIESNPVGRSTRLPLEYRGQRFDHFGDLDVDDVAGLVWVAVEGGGAPALMAFTPDLRYERHLTLPQKFAPWCAYKDGLVYTSEFGAGIVTGYDVSLGFKNAKAADVRCLPKRYDRIQGGVFDDHDRLVLSVDADDAPMIVVVNKNGTLHQEIKIDRRAFGPLESVVNALAGEAITRDKEMQGLHYENGALMVLVSDKNWWSDDGLILLHYTEVAEDFE